MSGLLADRDSPVACSDRWLPFIRKIDVHLTNLDEENCLSRAENRAFNPNKGKATSVNKVRYLIAVIVSVLALMNVATLPANATASEVLVAASGSQTSDCQTVATACNSIFFALTVVSDGGTIRCVGPVGVVGGFTVNQGVTIDCALAGGGINAQSIQINAPGKNVTLSNLTVNCLSVCGDNAIDIVAAGTVALENVKVIQANGTGILDHRTGGQTKLFIKDTLIRNNAGAGIVAVSAATGITVLDNVTSEHNTYGIAVGNGNNVSIRNSVFSGNSVAGVEGDAGSHVVVSGSTISHNNIGVQSSASVRVKNNEISFNNAAFSGLAATLGLNSYNSNVSMGTAPGPVPNATADIGP